MRKAVLVSLAALLCGCGGGTQTSPLETNVCGNFDTSLVALDRFGQSVTAFNTGEAITFRYTFSNKTQREQVLSAETYCGGSFEVKDAAGAGVYDPSKGIVCVTSNLPYEAHIKAGESRTESISWDQQRNENGSGQVAAASYTIRHAGVPYTSCRSAFARSLDFNIR